jgi:hypothetical protein
MTQQLGAAALDFLGVSACRSSPHATLTTNTHGLSTVSVLSGRKYAHLRKPFLVTHVSRVHQERNMLYIIR